MKIETANHSAFRIAVVLALCALTASQAHGSLTSGWGFDSDKVDDGITSGALAYRSQAGPAGAGWSVNIVGTLGTLDSAARVAVSQDFTTGVNPVVLTLKATGGESEILDVNSTTPSRGTIAGAGMQSSETISYSSPAAALNLNGTSTVNFQEAAVPGGDKVYGSQDQFAVKAWDISPVPEPITLALPLFGLAFIGGSIGGFYLRRRQQVQFTENKACNK